jgi:Fe-Mn family superoxide dismutase
MEVQLPNLPFPKDALTPFMSAETLMFHHGKHHAGYVRKLNDLLKTTPYEADSLRDIVIAAHTLDDQAVFNNAAQALNHEIFWDSLSANGQQPEGPLASAIDRDFGGLQNFKDEFRRTALNLFGSGWVWLVADEGRLRIVDTRNAGTPVVDGLEPLLTLDVWEHAYYLDVQNDRASYVDAFLGNLINWSGASERYHELERAA